MLVKNIEIGTDAIDTSRGDTDVIMEETLVPIVTDRIGSTSLNDLILSIAEIQMNLGNLTLKVLCNNFRSMIMKAITSPDASSTWYKTPNFVS